MTTLELIFESTLDKVRGLVLEGALATEEEVSASMSPFGVNTIVTSLKCPKESLKLMESSMAMA